MTNVIAGKIEGRVGRGRRRKQPLADLQEKRDYWKLNEEALYRTPWRTCFGRGCGPVLRQTTESVNERMKVFFLPWRCDPTRVMGPSFLRFLDHTQRRTTVGRTPLDEWSPRRRDLCLKHTTLTTDKHPCPRWDSNPRSQQASGRRPTPWPRGYWDRH